MNKSEVAQLKVRLDISDAQTDCNALYKTMDSINGRLDNLSQWNAGYIILSIKALGEAFSVVAEDIQSIPTGGSFLDVMQGTLESVNTSLVSISQWDMSGLVSNLDVIADKTSFLAEQIGTVQMDKSLIEEFSNIATVLSLILEVGSAIVASGIIAEIGRAFIEVTNFTSGMQMALTPMASMFSMLYNLGAWLTGTLIPVLGKIMEAIASIFGGSMAAAVALIVSVIVILIQNVDKVCNRLTALWEDHIKPIGEKFNKFVMSVSENLMSIWKSVLEPIISWVLSILEPAVLTVVYAIIGVFDYAFSIIKFICAGFLDVIDGVIEIVASVFIGDWKSVCDGFAKIGLGAFELFAGGIRVVVNGIIWFVNLFIGILYTIFAGVFNVIGGVVSVIGHITGNNWGFSVPTDPPQIPYLAHGAVLPANKPFLAVVGDQKHGTNVEAPLATIQEAVALVMQDQFSGMMAGFEASVGVQKQILQAVLGIEIGDSTIGQAAARYNRKMAVIQGGM